MRDNRPSAVITGIGGQDGSYLAELLLAKGYRVYGTSRGKQSSRALLTHVEDQIEFVQVDFQDEDSIQNLLQLTQPVEFYNLRSQSFVPRSWEEPLLTCEANATAVLRLLASIR